MKKRMTKKMIFLLALVFVLAMAAGCGDKETPAADGSSAPAIEAGSGAIDDTDATDITEDTDATTIEWPTADLPDGFPEYTSGTIAYIGDPFADETEQSDGEIPEINIDGPDAAATQAYIDTLIAAGWTFADESVTTLAPDSEIALLKDNLAVILVDIDGGESLSIVFEENL